MHSNFVVQPFGLFLVFVSTASSLSSVNDSSITWGSCSDVPVSGSSPVECSELAVPLDYTAPNSSQTLTLQLAKTPATKAPVLGSILLNLGGPGYGGREYLSFIGEVLQEFSGGQHDIIAFDPRGTANTIPFECYGDNSTLLLHTILNRETGNASNTALGTNWAMGKVMADACYEKQKKTGEFIGTDFVARDMMRIVDALGGDRLLRYWGHSYGSVIGARVAAMFPDRVERMVLDGIVNIHEYFNHWDTSWILDTDKTLSALFTECAAAPWSCLLAQNGLTAEEIEKRFYWFLENDLKFNPLAGSQVLLDYSIIKKHVFSRLQAPQLWATLANDLHGLMTKNQTLIDGIGRFMGAQYAVPRNEALVGIRCADKAASLRFSSLEEARSAMEEHYKVSRLAGDMFTSILMRCAQWRMPAKEHPGRDLSANVKMRQPMLLIGNTYDPVTPIDSAFNMSASFEGSVVLRQDGYGHTSTSQISACTIGLTQAYFVNGTLPEPGTVCKPDSGEIVFPPQANRTVKGRRTAENQDEKLALSLRRLQLLKQDMLY